MPEKMEMELRHEVETKHPHWPKEKKDAYIYGTMRKTGWKPSTQKKP